MIEVHPIGNLNQVPGTGFRLGGGQPVHEYRLAAGTITTTVWDYGAHLIDVTVPDRAGRPLGIVKARGDLDAYLQPGRGGYPGATVGRYANRIARGLFTLDGQTHQLATNDGPNHLHGGVVGFDQWIWHAEPFEGSDATGVTFRLTSPDGDQGYPGTLDAEVTYVLGDDNTLGIHYRATTDAPTVVNLTNHAYWNLAGAGPVTDHVLTLAADRYLLVDDTQIPTGAQDPVTGTRFDFTTPRRLGDPGFETGFDHCYVLADSSRDAVTTAAILHDPASGRRMTVSTDQPGIQVYTANHLAEPHTAICLETQHWPDSPNRPDFPSPVLRPGQVYEHHTTHHFDLA